MLETINHILLTIADPLFGFLLALPRDIVLIIVSIGTALILTLMRLFSTNQELLRRCSNDKKILGRRIKQVKKRDDTETVQAEIAALRERAAGAGFDIEQSDTHRMEKVLKQSFKRPDVMRLRNTKNSVALKTLKQEGLPLLVSLPLIALIAVWAFARIGYFPPDAGEPVTVTMYFPRSDAGSIVHMQPVDGLEVEDGWVRKIELETDLGQVYGVARWTLQAPAREEAWPLVIRGGTQSWEHSLLIGQRKYSEPLKFYGDSGEHVMEISLEEYRPFGLVGRIPYIPLAPWIVGYLIIVIPFVPILKRVTKIF